eukprot:1368839-Pleurochrysis_carterae.AAC.8
MVRTWSLVVLNEARWPRRKRDMGRCWPRGAWKARQSRCRKGSEGGCHCREGGNACTQQPVWRAWHGCEKSPWRRGLSGISAVRQHRRGCVAE